MRQEKYFCDKCKKEVKSSGELGSVSIKLNEYKSGLRTIQLNFDLCMECQEKVGLIKKVVKENKIVPESTDTKDKLYDIIVEILAETGLREEY